MSILKRTALGLVLALVATMSLAQSEYRARAGDTLNVEVLEDSSLNRSVVVLPDGRFSFPFAGTLTAAGRTVDQIEASIRSAISSNFAVPPTVFVSVQPGERQVQSGPSTRTIDVYFLGEVNSPGLQEVEQGTTFLQAIAQAGGLTRFAATKRIQLRSSDPATGQPIVRDFNYKAISDGAALLNDPRLRDGDVILVPERRLFE